MAAGAADGSGGFARRGGRSGMRPTFGTVSSANGTSLVVKTSGDVTVTVTLSDSTQITDDSGATASASSIKVVDTIAAFGTASSDGSSVTATRVRLNPAFGGGGGSQQTQPDSSGAVTN